MDKSLLRDKAEAFLKLHNRSNPLKLPNAWDVASARIFEQTGFAALATTSGGICRTLGFPDSETVGRDLMLSVIHRITQAVKVPVSADMMEGFGEKPADVADTVRAVLEAGAIGMNIEDQSGNGLRDVDAQCARIAAARQEADRAGVPFVINARVDTYLRQVAAGQERIELTTARARAYIKAGASCVYPITAHEAQDISALTSAIDAPLNIMMAANVPAQGELQKMGVARVSYASGIMRAAMALTKRIAEEIHTQGTCTTMLKEIG